MLSTDTSVYDANAASDVAGIRRFASFEGDAGPAGKTAADEEGRRDCDGDERMENNDGDDDDGYDGSPDMQHVGLVNTAVCSTSAV